MSKSLPARIVGVIFSPRVTYAEVAARPRILGVMLFVLFTAVGTSVLFLMTDVGKDALFDQQMEAMESFGFSITDEMYEAMERQIGYAPLFSAAGMLVTFPLMFTVISGLIFGVFALLGADATFKQVYAIVVHSAVLMSVQQLFVNPLNYARRSMAPPATIGAFFPFLEETSFLARLLGSIDLFLVWIIMSLAIGVGVLYGRRTAPIAATLLTVYMVIVVVIAAVRSAFAGA
jgi:hypothetical protein